MSIFIKAIISFKDNERTKSVIVNLNPYEAHNVILRTGAYGSRWYISHLNKHIKSTDSEIFLKDKEDFTILMENPDGYNSYHQIQQHRKNNSSNI